MPCSPDTPRGVIAAWPARRGRKRRRCGADARRHGARSSRESARRSVRDDPAAASVPDHVVSATTAGRSTRTTRRPPPTGRRSPDRDRRRGHLPPVTPDARSTSQWLDLCGSDPITIIRTVPSSIAVEADLRRTHLSGGAVPRSYQVTPAILEPAASDTTHEGQTTGRHRCYESARRRPRSLHRRSDDTRPRRTRSH
jgi:hypothetical protein